MMWLNYNKVTRFRKFLFLVSFFALCTSSYSYAQEPYQDLVRRFETPELGISNPAGILYSPRANALLVTPSRGTGKFVALSFAPDRIDSVSVSALVADPSLMSYDDRFDRVLFWDASARELVEIRADQDGYPMTTPGAVTRFDGTALAAQNASGMSVDPQTGTLFLLLSPPGQGGSRILRISPNAQGRFNNPTTSTIQLNALRNVSLRGLAFNPNDGHLYVMAPGEQRLYELAMDGTVESTRDVSAFDLADTQSMTFAPSGDQTDDPDIMNLYLAGNRLNAQSPGALKDGNRLQLQSSASGSGDISELSLTQPVIIDLSDVTTQATLQQTVLTSQWSPASPDPTGVAYVPSSGNLTFTDSEVNEMTIYAGVNAWERTLTNGSVRTYNTLAFSDEPTGVAYNPANGHFFYSDDTGVRRVYEVDPGNDGLPGTGDDVVTSIRTGQFGSSDPEGVAYDTAQGHLFIADGVNREVYEVNPGPNGIFDGVSPDGDDTVTSFDTQVLGLLDPEGVEYNSDTDRLYILSQDDDIIIETERDGTVVSVIDLAFLDATNLSGLGYAPNSSNPLQRSLYIVARGRDNDSDPNENDGIMYEILLEQALPGLGISDVTVTEGDAGTTNASFTVTLSESSPQTVTVNYATANGTATAGSDYVSTSGQVSFSPGQTSRPVNVTVNGDLLAEADETFFVNLSNASQANIIDGQGVGTINNDDPIPTLSINDVSASEAAGTMTFTVTLSGQSGQDVDVDYSTAIGTAVSPDDFASASNTLTIPSGSTSGTIDVTLVNDVLDETNENFTVNLSNPNGATIADGQGQGTITDNDPTPSLSIADASEDEGVGTMSFTVSLSAVSGRDVSVNYSTANGTAVAPGDYSATSGTLNISAGSSSGTIDVTIVDDSDNENDETFTVNLTGPVNATIADAQATGTIVDNEGVPLVTINDVAVAEGNSGTVNANFTVTLSTTSPDIVTVDYATADGTATAGSDYVAGSGQVTFQPGETTQPIAVAVNGDTIDEANETFVVNLSNASNASISDNQGQGTINDDDGGPSISINDVSVAENAGTMSFTVSLSAVSGQNVSVDYATANGSATAPADYTAASGTLNIPANSGSGTIDITIINDVSVEPTETFTVNLSNPVNATLADNQGTGSITNDDSGGTPVTVIFQDGLNGYSGTRDATILSSSSTTNFGAEPEIEVDGSPDGGGVMMWDLSSISPGSQVTAVDLTLYVTSSTDDTYEIYEVLQPWVESEVTWNQYTSGFNWETAGIGGATDRGSTALDAITAPSKGSLTVSLAAPVVALVQSWVNNPSSNFGFTLQDYANASDGLDFASRDNSDQTRRPALAVTYVENSEPTLTIDSITLAEPESGTANAVFTVSLTPAASDVVTVNFATANGTAVAPGDYVSQSGQVTFQVGETSQPISVVVNSDGTPESNETFVVNLSNPVNAGLGNNQGTATITDIVPPTITISDVSVPEGNSGTTNAVFTVSLSAASTQTITVDYATADGTAIAPGDYVPDSDQLSFAPGETSKPITVLVNGDVANESDETFVVDLSNPVNATIGDTQGEGTITNDDSGGGFTTVSFQEGVNGYAGTEDTHLDSTAPSTSFGGVDRIEMDGSPDMSVILKWDISSIPAGSNVESVEISVFIRNGSTVLYDIYEMLRPWQEGSATWNQFAAGQNWQIAGANGSQDRGTTALGVLTGPRGATTLTLNAAGVAVVQSWVDNPSSNNGFVFLDYDEGSNGLSFFSSERRDVEVRPQLTITYANGGTASIQAAKASPDGLLPKMDEDLFETEALPETVALNPNYPNPFRLETKIDYALPEQARVRMEIYNIRGQLVRVLIDGMQPAGYQSVRWDGRDDAGRPVASGVYFNRLWVDQQNLVGKIVLQK